MSEMTLQEQSDLVKELIDRTSFMNPLPEDSLPPDPDGDSEDEGDE